MLSKRMLTQIVILAGFVVLVVVISIAASVAVNKGTSQEVQTSAKQIEDLAAQVAENEQLIEDSQNESQQLKSTVTESVRALQRSNIAIQNYVKNIASSGDVKWILNTANSKNYAVTTTPLPWVYADKLARELGGQLVSINDEAENIWLVENFESDVEYWTGLNDRKEEGQWQWTDGSQVTYTNWLKGEPDNYRNEQHCVFINAKVPARNLTEPGKWNDAPGNECRLAIIEK